MICNITLIFFSAVVACLVKKKKHNENKMRMLCVIFQLNRLLKVTFTT